MGIVVVVALCGCSGASMVDGDGGGEDEVGETDGLDGPSEEGEPDTADEWWPPYPDWSGTEMLDAGPVDVPYVDQCGNGIVDDGEECDDWNRLNGDGCDWNCRRGDGEPPPPPDPEAIDYLAEGDGPTVIEDVGVPVDAILDLAWTGREFAVALCEDMTPAVHSDDAWQFHFVRFDGYGRRVGPAWRYPASRFASIRLVWTGEGFGLFYNDQGWGIVMLRLDPDGKPYWPPVLAVPDGTARDFDADWTGEAFVVAWTSGAPGAPMSCAPSSGSLMLRVALVDRFGALRDRPAPITVEDEAFGMVNVAAGDLGFAVSFSGRGPSMYLGAYCAPRVVWIDRELDRVVPSGMLSGFGMIRDLGWGGAEFAVAWLPRTDGEWGSLVCSARFGSSGGALLGPPGCVDLIDLEIDGTRGDVRLAARDHGMALLLTHAPSPETPRPVLLLNVDRHGTPVGEPHDVAGSMTVDPASHAIVPSEVGYGVVFGSLGTLALRTFRAAP